MVLSFIDKFKNEHPTIQDRMDHRLGLADVPEKVAEPITDNFNFIEFNDNGERQLLASQIAGTRGNQESRR